jgi:4-amino-4-deoxy-L-arabinose transferase-like glycosyltransferase
MPSIQDLVHKFEEKSGRGMLLTFVVLVVGALVVAYNWRGYRNMSNQEAMDAAQVARNLAEGDGFSTDFIRPFSLTLVKKHNQDQMATTNSEGRPDFAQVRGLHPDLANPPLYPLFLAGAMKVLPFDFKVNVTQPFWSTPNTRLHSMTPEQQAVAPPRLFARYQPDFLIALLNQGMLIVVAVMTFFLARRLYDAAVAWMSFALVIACEVLWRFSVTGLSTLFLMVIFLSLIWCLVWIENEERDPVWSHRAQTWLALAIGLLLGLGTLTRYSFGWLVIPVLVYLAIFCVLRRWLIVSLVLGVFLLVVTPWIGRNISVSGTPFGIAGYALVDGTFGFPEYKMQRALDPDFRSVNLMALIYKLTGNVRLILQEGLPRLGGSWVSALFLTGLLLSFRSLALRRLRYFLLAALFVLVIAQALGKTQLSVESPDFNTENLIVLLVPLVFIYGAGLFFQLLDQMNLRLRELRLLVIGVFAFLVNLPIIFTMLSPSVRPVAYPQVPYYPPAIQEISGYLKPGELMMSDIPWAVAWYGNRQAVWLTANVDSEYYGIHDYLKPIRMLYLTPLTTDSRILSQWVWAGLDKSWPTFILEFLFRKRVPEKFPLQHARAAYFPAQLVLCDYQRWTDDGAPALLPDREEEKPAPAKSAAGQSASEGEKK